MWLAQSAIPRVPSHARLSEHALEVAKNRLTDTQGVYTAALLAQAFRRCEREQPALADWLERRLSRHIDDAARGLGASMAMTLWVAFSHFAGPRLRQVSEQDCTSVEQLLEADEELRREDPDALVESDDIIAAHQPEVAKVLRAHLNETLSAYADDIDVDDVDAMYQMLLVEVLVLSYAVEPLQPGPDSTPRGVC